MARIAWGAAWKKTISKLLEEALGRIDTHTHAYTPHHANLTTKAASKSVLGAYYTDRLGKRRSVKNGPTLCRLKWASRSQNQFTRVKSYFEHISHSQRERIMNQYTASHLQAGAMDDGYNVHSLITLWTKCCPIMWPACLQGQFLDLIRSDENVKLHISAVVKFNGCACHITYLQLYERKQKCGDNKFRTQNGFLLHGPICRSMRTKDKRWPGLRSAVVAAAATDKWIWAICRSRNSSWGNHQVEKTFSQLQDNNNNTFSAMSIGYWDTLTDNRYS